MAADVTQAQNFVLDSDFPPEKVAVKVTQTFSVNVHLSHSDAQLFTIPHGLSFTPLCRGAYRYTNSLGSIDWEMIDTSLYLGQAGLGTTEGWSNLMITAVYSDATNIYFYIWNQSGVVTSMDVRIIGFMDPITGIGSIPSTNQVNNNFVYNTDNNYLKIISSGGGTVNISASTTAVVIPHNLGYVPLVFAWAYNPDTQFWGAVSTENYIGTTYFDSNLVVDTQNLTINLTSYGGGTTPGMYAYRIFADG